MALRKLPPCCRPGALVSSLGQRAFSRCRDALPYTGAVRARATAVLILWGALGACASGSEPERLRSDDGAGADAGGARSKKDGGKELFEVGAPSGVGDPCEQDEDCPTAHCVRGERGGRVCTATCGSDADCKQGWSCIPEVSSLCKPCEGDESCDGEGSLCMEIGRGNYCGRPCSRARPCPDDYRCVDIRNEGGQVIDHQCRPRGDQCGTCEDADEDHYGEGAECWGADCDDSIPTVHADAPELCNGVDDDCDGETDEEAVDLNACGACGEAPAEECNGVDDDCDGEADEGDDGPLSRDCSTVCGEGVETCLGGEWFNCSAQQPLPETCGDGLDNDCFGGDERRPDIYEPNNDCASARGLGNDPENLHINPTIDSVDDGDDFFKFTIEDDSPSFPFTHKEELEIDLLRMPPGIDLRLHVYGGQAGCELERPWDFAAVGDCGGHQCLRFEESRGPDEGGELFIRIERLNEAYDCGATYQLRIHGLH